MDDTKREVVMVGVEQESKSRQKDVLDSFVTPEGSGVQLVKRGREFHLEVWDGGDLGLQVLLRGRTHRKTKTYFDVVKEALRFFGRA